MDKIVLLLSALIILSGCGKGGSGTSSPTGSDITDSGGRVEFHIIQGKQITQIIKNGNRLLVEPPRGGGGGHYIIGDCDGTDSMERNIWSVDEKMKDKPGCPGPEYKLEYTRQGNDRIRVRVEIGPITRGSINSIKTALDGDPEIILYSQIAGREKIPFNNRVSIPVASQRSGGRVSWVELSGPKATIRRTPISGNYSFVQCNNHPGASNCDIEFGSMRIGDAVFFEEEIWVY